VRFFLISRKADTEFVFDVDLALKQSDEKPGVLRAVRARADLHDPRRLEDEIRRQCGRFADRRSLAALERTCDGAAEQARRYPDMLSHAADELAPHAVAFYLRDLAGEFHSFYNAERVLVDEDGVRNARIALLAATRQVLGERPRADRRVRPRQDVIPVPGTSGAGEAG